MLTSIDLYAQMQRAVEKVVQQSMGDIHQVTRQVEAINRAALELWTSLATCPALEELERAMAATKEQWAEISNASFLPSNDVLHGGRFRRY